MRFLHPARARPNLEVVTGAHVVGLVVKSGRVEGVRYIVGKTEKTCDRGQGGHSRRVARLARRTSFFFRALARPTICEAVGIPVVHDLPGVGENLQDHLLTVVQYRTQAGGSRTYNLLASLGWLAPLRRRRQRPVDPAAGPLGRLRAVPTRPRCGPNLQFHVLPWGGFTPNFDEKRNPDSGAMTDDPPDADLPGEPRRRFA